jgi:hypothetical protein
MLARRLVLILALVGALSACVARLEELSQVQTGSAARQVAESVLATPTETPWPTPALVNAQGIPLTPTPELHPAVPSRITPEVYPTPTLKPFTKIVNQAEGLPEAQTYVFLVNRADGSSEKYILRLADMPITDANAYLELRDNLLKLGPDDIVTFEGPATRRVKEFPDDPFLELENPNTPTPRVISDNPAPAQENSSTPTPMQLFLPSISSQKE